MCPALAVHTSKIACHAAKALYIPTLSLYLLLLVHGEFLSFITRAKNMKAARRRRGKSFPLWLCGDYTVHLASSTTLLLLLLAV